MGLGEPALATGVRAVPVPCCRQGVRSASRTPARFHADARVAKGCLSPVPPLDAQCRAAGRRPLCRASPKGHLHCSQHSGALRWLWALPFPPWTRARDEPLQAEWPDGLCLQGWGTKATRHAYGGTNLHLWRGEPVDAGLGGSPFWTRTYVPAIKATTLVLESQAGPM